MTTQPSPNFSASTTSPAPPPSRGRKLYILGSAGTLVGAGLIWLSLSSELAATGRRIAALDAERADLLERRAVVLTAFAAATDPRALERAAVRQGFGPGVAVEYLGVAPAVIASQSRPETAPDTPLAIMRTAAGAAGADAIAATGPDMPAMLLSAGVAAPALADERPSNAVGGEDAGR